MSSPKAKKLSYTQVGHKLGFMEWNESYDVNVAAIDAQHKKNIPNNHRFSWKLITPKNYEVDFA